MDVDGLHVEVVGRGAPAMVLHGGLGLDHTLYRSLEPIFDGLQLIYLDHRGNGRSGRPDPATLTMAGWADDAHRVGRVVVGDTPLVVIGHSYGGFIAQELAIRHPAAVAALVLVCTTPGQLGNGELPAPPGPPVPVEFERMVAAPPATDDEMASAMAALPAAYVHRCDPAVLQSLMAGTVFSASAMRRGFDVLGEWSSVDRLGSITAPTLIIAGRHDGLTSWPQAGRIAARVPGAEVVVLDDSSHFPWLDEPEPFTTAVRTWLAAHGLIA